MRLFGPILLLASLLSPWLCFAQSCCSGGVPLSSNLGLPASQAGVLQLNLSYDLNVLNTLKVERERLDDDSRNRITHSALLQLSYSLTDRWAVEGFFSFLRQERRINQEVSSSLEAAQGIGDAVFLLKYKLWATAQEETVWQIALGAKAPTGPYDRRSGSGLILNAELQPGGGAWDGILWSQLTHSMDWRPSMSFSTTATYSRKGENEDYLNGSQHYKFGDEWQLIVGLSDQLALGKRLLDPSLSFRYRNAQPDLVDGFDLPSTGGQWVFLNPAFSYWWSSNLASNASVELPVYAKVIGTQFSPTFRLNIGFFYRIPTRPNKI
ncbi:MAG: transporter [Bacteroidota bacterium]